ncbi:MAG: hypothetical protein ACOYMN_14965 [Roseimicrobium sp.]
MSAEADGASAAWWRLVAWLVLSVGIPCWLLHGDAPKGAGEREVPRERDARPGGTGAATIDVAQAIAELRREQPDCIGIGNSMLFTRLGKTPDAMTALTGRKFHLLLKNGSSTAIWYLLLKNVVVASGVRPRVVFFFVRDDELTAPITAIGSNEATYLDSLRGADEPELDRLLGVGQAQADLGSRVSAWGQGWFTFPAWQASLSQRLSDLAMDIGAGGARKKALRFMLTERFSLEHLRGDLASDKAAGASDLDAGIAGTPLEAMLDLADKHALRLLFFRIKRRPDAATGMVADDPSGMQAYAQRLKTIVERRGGWFYDETYDPAITLADYLDGDHIRPERMGWYQRYFWERLGPLLP